MAADDAVQVSHDLASRPSAFPDIATKLRVAAALFDGRLPRTDELRGHRGLFLSLRPPHGTIRELSERLHFSPRALVPYVVLLTIDTTFNAEGMLTLDWDQVARTHPIFGSDRWQISVRKKRADSASNNGAVPMHTRSFATGLSDPETPVNLLLTLERFTTYTRRHVEQRYRDRVFLFHAFNRDTYRSYEGSAGCAEDGAWHRALKEFIDGNGLPAFTLRTLRATGGDFVHEVTGDIKAQQVALGHASLTTTLKHYRGGAAKQRDEEALSHGMAWRERYIGSEGRSDTRPGALSPGSNSAATPGFGCLDPMNSPVPGQRAGRMCAAFGSCAACPLAVIHAEDPRSYARLLQFSERIEQARTRLNPVRFIEMWQPQAEWLAGHWLPKFTAKAHVGATLALPPYPELE